MLRRANELSEGGPRRARRSTRSTRRRSSPRPPRSASRPPPCSRAIAIERLGPPPAGHLGDRLVGAGTVVVDEELPGRAYDVIARIDAWLVDGHHLRRDRLREDRGEWSKRTGVVGAAIRTIRGVTGEGRLGDLRRVAATARDTGTGTCVVRVEADRRHDRSVHAAAGAVVAGAGTAGVVAVAVVAAPVDAARRPADDPRRRRAGGDRPRPAPARSSGRSPGSSTPSTSTSRPARLRVDVMRRVAGRPRRA